MAAVKKSLHFLVIMEQSPTLFHVLVFDLTFREWEIHNKNYFGIHTY